MNNSILNEIYGGDQSNPHDPNGWWGPITRQYYESEGAKADAEYTASMRLQGQRGSGPLDKMTPEEIRAAFDLAVQDEYARAADIRREADAQEFVRQHPEYKATPDNGKALTLILEARKHSGNRDELESAFELLKSRGALDLDTTKTPAPAEPQARRSSGLSSRGSVRSAPHEETIEELYRIPLEELEQRANRAAAREARQHSGFSDGPEEY